MANPGGDFSMAALVAPVPVNMAGMVLDIVRIVPHALAGKVLQVCALTQHNVELPDQGASNRMEDAPILACCVLQCRRFLGTRAACGLEDTTRTVSAVAIGRYRFDSQSASGEYNHRII